ncbi:uracil phosphoribosyltransferase-domain-containing protein [Aspergillus heterothallicus]
MPVCNELPVITHHTRIPRIVGLYGLPGTGKSYLLNQLKRDLDSDYFAFFEGSEVIDTVTPGGLAAFKSLEPSMQKHFRERAIDNIKKACLQSGKVGIVTGHFMFWNEEEEGEDTGPGAKVNVCTQNDLEAYTHILYLNTPIEQTARQRLNDKARGRSVVTLRYLQLWQQAEMLELRDLCRENGILFATIYPNLHEKLVSLLLDIQAHAAEHNEFLAQESLDKALTPKYDLLQTVVFLDADRTLTAEDTGKAFWAQMTEQTNEDNANMEMELAPDPLSLLFSSKLGYSYTAFRQAMLHYEERTGEAEFDAVCENVALQTQLYPQMSSLLRRLDGYSHICLVIVTCGLRRIWEKIVAREGLSETVRVIGGGRLKDGYVVTADVKRTLVRRAQCIHGAKVWAFGDSPLDIPMLSAADEALIVVGEETTRSKSMDEALALAISTNEARQILLPNDSSTTPRLTPAQLPIIDITSAEFLNEVTHLRHPLGGLAVHHLTSTPAAKLLMTPMRNASLKGPALRASHAATGRHLALTLLADLIGLEEIPIPHVQGTQTKAIGHQLLAEPRTLIIAIMRAGEPLASGISSIFVQARFLHAKHPTDVERKHLEGCVTVVLVDAVVNSGDTVVEFMREIRELNAVVRIIVVAGVVQESVVRGRSELRVLARDVGVTVVTLRLSSNKYKGVGGTDTGNRLFNTTYLS